MRFYPAAFIRFACIVLGVVLACACSVSVAMADERLAGGIQESPVDDSGTGDGDASTSVKIPASSLKGKTFKKGGFSYKVTKATASGTGTVTLVKRTSSKTTATIPATVSKSYLITKDDVTNTQVAFAFKVTAVSANAFNNTKGHKVKTLTVGKNVVRIGKKAFYGCKSLTKITFKGKKLGNKTTYTKSGQVKKSPIGKKAFSGVPRSCNTYTPTATGTNFGYIQGTRAAMTYAGFKGRVV